MTMSKGKEKASKKKLNKNVAAKVPPSRKRQRPAVQVVSCAAAFPISQKPPKQAPPLEKRDDRQKTKLLDFRDTALEIRHYGSTALQGKSKRQYQEEQFELLTGRKKKKHQVPLPIVRGIRKKAAEREARELQHAKEAGLVLPKKKKKEARTDSTRRVHGPAPSIGFMTKGVLRVKGKSK